MWLVFSQGQLTWKEPHSHVFQNSTYLPTLNLLLAWFGVKLYKLWPIGPPEPVNPTHPPNPLWCISCSLCSSVTVLPVQTCQACPYHSTSVVAVPSAWNALCPDVCEAGSLISFMSALKTHFLTFCTLNFTLPNISYLLPFLFLLSAYNDLISYIFTYLYCLPTISILEYKLHELANFCLFHSLPSTWNGI